MSQVLVLSALLGASFAVALAGARGILALVFHLMVYRRLPIKLHWRPIGFSAALFWCWYVGPGVAQSELFAHVISLLGP